ncbi:hypothetical protein TNIN_454851 [Trichonephila inaurata madagascariensis]|uniref:Uncharacterized protein n=1 Tax=Trichonephila inaurata madagascariensis TaxID=2747483 RepID=A0A8X7C4N0_9ARAC|nr:hypothetical protein TNIN_454851 [Trichonephila inaurata madagascariensis]
MAHLSRNPRSGDRKTSPQLQSKQQVITYLLFLSSRSCCVLSSSSTPKNLLRSFAPSAPTQESHYKNSNRKSKIEIHEEYFFSRFFHRIVISDTLLFHRTCILSGNIRELTRAGSVTGFACLLDEA